MAHLFILEAISPLFIYFFFYFATISVSNRRKYVCVHTMYEFTTHIYVHMHLKFNCTQSHQCMRNRINPCPLPTIEAIPVALLLVIAFVAC